MPGLYKHLAINISCDTIIICHSQHHHVTLLHSHQLNTMSTPFSQLAATHQILLLAETPEQAKQLSVQLQQLQTKVNCYSSFQSFPNLNQSSFQNSSQFNQLLQLSPNPKQLQGVSSLKLQCLINHSQQTITRLVQQMSKEDGSKQSKLSSKRNKRKQKLVGQLQAKKIQLQTKLKEKQQVQYWQAQFRKDRQESQQSSQYNLMSDWSSKKQNLLE